MRKLQIVAEGDVSHAKASLRSLSVEKGKQVAEEKRQAAESAAAARDAARTKIAEAKASGTAQREELKKLAQAERDAAKVAKQAAREAADAKREYATRVQQAARIQKFESQRLEREAGRQALAGIEGRAEDFRNARRQRAKLADYEPASRRPSVEPSMRREVRKITEDMMGFGAIAAAFAPIVMVIEKLITTINESRQKITQDARASGAAQSGFARKMRKSGMKEGAIASILSASDSIEGISTTDALSAAEEALDQGNADPTRIIDAMRKRAVEPAYTKSQRADQALSRESRRREIRRSHLIPGSSASVAFHEGMMDIETAEMANPKGLRGVMKGAEMVGEGFRSREAVRTSPMVRLPDDQIRSLSGPKRASVE